MTHSTNSLTKIKKLVEEKLTASHKEIVISVFQHMLNKHNDVNCNCDACEVLREYIRTKRYLQFKKRFYDNYDGCALYASIQDYKNQIKNLKEQRRLLKQL